MAAGIRGTLFNEMPVHCKKAKLAEQDFNLPGALAESDPKRAAMAADLHGSPGRRTPPTLKTGQSLAPEHIAQMRALAATGKFDNEDDPDANHNSIPGFVGAETSGGDSDNLSNFGEAVKAVRDILLANNGKNSCAELFRGRGEEALIQISNSVTSAGNAAFRPLADAAVGIHMSFIGRFSPAEALNIEIVRNVDGEYEAVGLITNPVVTINTLGSFVRAFPVSNMEAHRLPRFGGYRAGSLQSRVVQLLHEIGHLIFVGTIPTNVVVGVNGKKMTYRKVVLLFPADDLKPGLSETNTDSVIDECGRLIDALD